MSHSEKHPLAGAKVKVKFKGGHAQIPGSEFEPVEFYIEDWQDRVMGQSWKFMNGNPAAVIYGLRCGINDLPFDDEVIYGKTLNGLAHMVHVSELVVDPSDFLIKN